MADILGKLIGIGVGPGDPGMVTVRGAEVIRAASTIAFPVHKPGAGSRALEAARPYLAEEVACLPLLMPMTRDRLRLDAAHAAAVETITSAVSGGTDVVYLALGDPLFYSTFGYLAERFTGPVEVISGVSAISATAAAAGISLAEGDIPTVVVSGNDRDGLLAALDMGASIVVIKPRSLSAESLDLLEARGVLVNALAAIELGSPGQRLQQGLDRGAVEELPYFAIVWIKPDQGGDDAD